LVPLPHEKRCQFLTAWLSVDIERHPAPDCPLLLLHRPHLRGAIQTTPVRASKKKLPTCKPDPVPASLRAVIIYLAPALLQGSSCLPSGVASFRCFGRAALDRRYTWHFSMQGLPAPAVTRRRRGLLPHVFILTSCEAVIFCGTGCGCFHTPRRLTGTLPFAVRTFLPPQKRRAMTRLVATAKIE
jgi:hypothetical protein